MEFLEGLLNIYSIIGLLIGLVIAIIGGIKLIKLITKIDNRIYNNLRRKIYLFTTSNIPNLQREYEILKNNGIYNVHNQIIGLSSDIGLLQIVDDYSFFIIGYSKEYPFYEDIIERAKRNSIPLVVFAPNDHITEQHMISLRAYPYFDMCNTTARLLATIYSLSCTMPHE